MNHDQIIAALCKTTIGGSLTSEEKSGLKEWHIAHKSLLEPEIRQEWLADMFRFQNETAVSWEKFKQMNLQGAAVPAGKYRPMWPWMAAACAVLALAIVFSLLKRNKPDNEAIAPVIKREEFIVPGSNKAILTLADKTTIPLGARELVNQFSSMLTLLVQKGFTIPSLESGAIATQGFTTITLVKDGKLAYHPTALLADTNTYTNELSTPRGGEYQVTLPDGSTVQLNSISGIRYPTAFTGNERVVELLGGEACFKVAPNKQKPFKIKLRNGNAIEVLGTYFNINTFDTAKINKTTLLEGTIKITTKTGSKLIKADHQAWVDEKHRINIVKVDPAAMKQEISWTRNQFSFTETDLKVVMQQLQRWYDMEVVYEAPLNNRKVTAGPIPMDTDIKKVLESISGATSFHYRIENKKVILTE